MVENKGADLQQFLKGDVLAGWKCSVVIKRAGRWGRISGQAKDPGSRQQVVLNEKHSVPQNKIKSSVNTSGLFARGCSDVRRARRMKSGAQLPANLFRINT